MTTSHQKEQAERIALAGSTGSMTFNTYRDRAISDLELQNQGRHAKGAEVIGAKASVRYPRLPADNPFTTDISGVEPPTGIDINWQEPNGTPAEIAESLREAASVLAFPPDAEVSSMPATIDDLASPAFVPCVGEANSNVIVGSPSDNPTNAEVGGEAGRGDVGPGVHGDACTGTTSPLLRRGRKL
jgi:hypothetical protein